MTVLLFLIFGNLFLEGGNNFLQFLPNSYLESSCPPLISRRKIPVKFQKKQGKDKGSLIQHGDRSSEGQVSLERDKIYRSFQALLLDVAGTKLANIVFNKSAESRPTLNVANSFSQRYLRI